MDNLMGNPIQPEQEPAKEEKTLAMLSHLLAIFFGFIPGLIIWLIKKDQSRFVGQNAFQSMMFSLGVLVVAVALSIFSFAIQFIPVVGQIVGCVLCLVFAGILVYALVLFIQGTMKANAGLIFKYPFTGDLFAYPDGGDTAAPPPPAPPTE